MTMWSIRIRVFLSLLAAVAAGGAIPTRAADETPPAKVETAGKEGAAAKALAKMVVVDPRTLEFTAIPDMPDCATGAVLRGDPRSEPSWVLLKLASNCRVPLHWHSVNEDMIVISGQGSIAMTDAPALEFVPGAFASLPAHHTHQANCKFECLLFASSDGPFDIHYVDANGEEISAGDALDKTPTPVERTPTPLQKIPTPATPKEE